MHPALRVSVLYKAIRRALAVPALIVWAAASWPAAGMAQVPSSSKAACPASEVPDPAMVARLREIVLTPGPRVVPATYMRDPAVATFAMKIMQQAAARAQTDWPALCRYRADNAAQQAAGATDVVFLGDSITENWLQADPGLFSSKIIDRGISGQTSSQILLRFYPDVVALHPQVVHIMAGTNDILHGSGTPVVDDDIVNNISAMIDMAQANRIKVVLASILPISVGVWRPDLKPAQRLIALNARLSALAKARRVTFVDYFAVLKDPDNDLNTALGNDGVHPNRAGYAAMRPLTDRAINWSLRGRN